MKKKKLSHKLGSGLAYLQDTVDRIMTFGFEKLSSTGKKKPQKDEHPLQKGARKTASFLGEVGTSFYEEYTELKDQKREKKK